MDPELKNQVAAGVARSATEARRQHDEVMHDRKHEPREPLPPPQHSKGSASKQYGG